MLLHVFTGFSPPEKTPASVSLVPRTLFLKKATQKNFIIQTCMDVVSVFFLSFSNAFIGYVVTGL